MMPLRIFSQRTLLVGAVSLASIVLGTLLFYQAPTSLARAFGPVSPPASGARTVYLSSRAAVATTTEDAFTREVHIANNGLTLLRGARVLSISGSTVEVEVTWGSFDLTWKAQTDFSTKFFDAEGEKISIANIHIGDILTITGTIPKGAGAPILHSDIIRK